MEFTFSAARLLFFVNFAPVVSIVILVAFIKTNVSFPDNVNRVFTFVCAAALLLVAADSSRFVTARMPHPCFLRFFSKSVGYILRCVIIYLITLIAKRKKEERILLYSIPLLICIIISTINIFPFGRGILFSVDENNVFHRGVLGFTPHSICVFYSMVLLYYSFKNFNHYRYEPFVVIMIEVASLGAMICEILFDFDFILCHVLISSIIFYYFFLLTQVYKRDTLTSFFNRRCFYLTLNHQQHRPMILLSMDLNNLKLLNDTYGHAEGDKALITVSREMNKAFSRHAKLYRTGGDEFMAIFKKRNISEVINLVSVFQDNLKKTDYRVACGFAPYTPGDDIDQIISICDERMYSNKAKIKKEESFKKI